ncbi:exodeoxyribonuclease VII large subunit [Actinobacteria bacterium YIM 96077]|uniref:Exodeoxyribonuclease 7 large subunit n=1 Tax=Phytoactinopolyspora halophila TaxID=1981511 RepID=A0A329QW09_9ACTN|nr:exodeoxyribonuclease VII large subunit [Phytoactinopolyspora halophila]AYY15640.1 exodeoxyribonuclease VII large subunit [Actinobacteria bacterium YIM 96077]RAW14908.1 exodeoxyribonuclease VII large subunit [Phytoactinopolyspora halophila]
MALDTSPEKPAPVRVVSQLIGQWIHRLGAVWIEGQVTQLNRRPGTQTAFLSLRDPAAEVSIQVTCPGRVLDALDTPLADGARIVVHARPSWYHTRGTLSLAADDIRPVGLGELLARLERLRRTLAAEGLFAPERKLALPFLPATIGLVCGRDSKAEHDVVENARRRWPGVQFRIEPVAVQGPSAAGQLIEAIGVLDRAPDIEVIIVARGGGSVEDLLPFSDEAVIRAVAAARTPVVSAIGHEADNPLLDLVADARASTPTDAAKHLVPDVHEELSRVTDARTRIRAALRRWIDREQAGLDSLRSRPALADAGHGLRLRADELDSLRERMRRTIRHRLERSGDALEHTRARLRALSPAATLERGYAVVQPLGDDAQRVIRSPEEVETGQQLSVRVAAGEFTTTVD